MGGGLSDQDAGLNARAWAIADRLAASDGPDQIAVQTLGNGARVIDVGIAVPGGLGAGLALAEICMGDSVRSRTSR